MNSCVRNRFRHHGHHGHHGPTWSHVRVALCERKLRAAAQHNNTDEVERILSHRIDPNTTDEQLRTALHFAASKGYTDTVRTLLCHGADPNKKDLLGNTALHLAACTNHIGVVTLLLKAGTNVSELDNFGRTPLQLAQSKLKMLRKNKANHEINTVP